MKKQAFEDYKKTCRDSRPDTFDRGEFTAFIGTEPPVYMGRMGGGYLWVEPGEISGAPCHMSYVLDHFYNGEIQFVPLDEWNFGNAYALRFLGESEVRVKASLEETA